MTRCPTFRDVDISFQNYPPGSACWVYFLCRFAGGGEGMMLFAQATLMLACLLPVFGLNRKRPAVGAAVAGGLATFVFLGGETLIGSLYVDQLLPLVAVAGAVAAATHADEPERAALLTAPFAIYTYLVKNSGLLFSRPAGAYAGMRRPARKAAKRRVKQAAMARGGDGRAPRRFVCGMCGTGIPPWFFKMRPPQSTLCAPGSLWRCSRRKPLKIFAW